MSQLNTIQPKNILVVGDVMLDRYEIGKVERISPEAPVPVLRKAKERDVPGGAANVAVNLAAANQRAYIMAEVGRDEAGERIEEALAERGIRCEMLLRGEKRTTVKTRYLAWNNQQLMRLDEEDAGAISEAQCERFLKLLSQKMGELDLIIVSDYMKGLLTEALVQGVIAEARRGGVKVLIDIKDANIQKYRGAYLLKPNLEELRRLTGQRAQTREEIVEASRALLRACDCRYVLTTCGAGGMILAGAQEEYAVASMGKEVYDVTGAGDTTIAYLGACLANGMDIRTAVLVADYAAGVQVGKVGTSSVTLGEVEAAFLRAKPGMEKKWLPREAAGEFRRRHENQKIVFTNGCFDILHIGHARCLREAAALGDILVVGLNSDASVRRLKGASRPVNPEQDRAEMLCALDCVDYVTVFDEDTPEELIRAIQPDVLVKGGDYRPEDVAGRQTVENRGGRVVILPFVPGKSTTGLISQIKSE